jgi:hypothetical protein
MFANPLIWLAPSCLPENRKVIFRKMIDLHLKYRKQIFEEEIYPVGDEPDGKSLTGFLSVNADGTKGFILAFREADGPESVIWDIPFVKSGSLKIKRISGNSEGSIEFLEATQFKISLKEKSSYLMVGF